MKKTLLPVILALFVCSFSFAQNISSTKTIFVEMFASNIFNVDENGDLTYEREQDLVNYCVNKNYDIAILNRLQIDYPSIFSDATIITTANSPAFETRLGQFLNSMHDAGVSIIGAQAAPYRMSMGNPVVSQFFRNVNEFNKRMLAQFGSADYCFDLIYSEIDWWRLDPTNSPDINWSNYYVPGIQEMKAQSTLSNNAGYHSMITGSYLGNLTTLSSQTPSQIVNVIDQNINLVFVHFYFIGNQANSYSAYFGRDKAFGRRLETFSRNSIQTTLIPLFSAESSADPIPGNQNFFGDYLIYDNGLAYNPTPSYTATVDQFGDDFDDYFSTQQDPYQDGGSVTATMYDITVGSGVPSTNAPNDMSKGLGWFKHGSLPDAKFYMWLPSDLLSIDGCLYGLSPEQIVNASGPNPHPNNVDVSTSLTPVISPVYKWYKDGVVQTTCSLCTTATPFIPISHNGIAETWTCEMQVDDPGNGGWFHQYKYRDDIVIKGSVPTVSISAASLTICPSDFITFDANPVNPGLTPTYLWTSSLRGIVGGNSSTLTLGSFTNNETITVAMTTTGTCGITVNNTVTITVTNVATPQITNLNNNYCSSDATVNLIGSPPGGTFLVDGVSTNELIPGNYGGTSIDVTYTINTPCTTSVTTNVTVNNVPNIILTTPIEVCENSGMLDLGVAANPNPAGGSFSGTWVTSPDFDVNSAGTGTHSVTYSYTDLATLCSNTASLNVEVTPNVTPTVTIFPNTSATILIGDPVTLSYSISPSPVCTNYIVEVWWRHEPQGAATEHFYTTIPCPPCTLDVVPTSLVDGGDQFITGDEFFLRYKPCDCATAVQFDSDNNLIVDIISDGCDPSNYINVVDIVPATCPSLNNGGFKATMPYPVNTYKLFSGSSWLLTVTPSISGSDRYAVFTNLAAGIYTVKAYDALDQLISFTETCDNGSPFTYYLETSLYINGINNLPFPVVSTNTNLNCGSSLSCGTFLTYQWYLNNVLLTDVNANSAVYPVSLDGNYKVYVTNSNGCGSFSSVVNVNNNFTAVISGPSTNCTTNVYSVSNNGSNSTYTWTVPVGATYTQTGNSISVNWGIAYGTGGQITCKVVDACGNQSLAFYNVSSCCNMTATLNVHSTCNGSTSNGSISSSVINNVGLITYSWNPNVSISSSLSHLSPGNYTLVATDSRGCTASATGQVLSSSLLTVSMNPYPACTPSNNGSVVSIPLGGVGPYTYWWNNLSTGYSITNVAAGTYTVTVTDSRGCTMTNSAVVNSIAGNFTKPIVSGPSSACQTAGTSVYTILNHQTNYNNLYNWYVVPNSGSYNITYPSNNKKVASITWSNTNGGKIIVRLGTSVCFITDTIFVQGCCQNTYTYYDGDFPDNVINSSTVTRANMTFNGNFIVNRDFAFVGCGQVSFAPGAKITVRGGTTLTIDNCEFRPSSGCCKMWKGIVLEKGARIIMKNGATIAEAECGIQVINRSTYDISKSSFRNNFIGIQIGDGIESVDLTGSAISSTEFYSDVFSCSGTNYNCFVLPYDGQTTVLGTRPYAGIDINLCSFVKIGKTPNVAGGDIRFYNLSNGIISHNSNLYVSNTSFKNIILDNAYTPLLGNFNGCGVSINGGYLSLKGLGGTYGSDNCFDNCNYGVVNNKGNCDVSLVTSTSDNNTVIYLSDTKKATVTNNCIQGTKYGVFTYHNPDADILIDKNDFRMSTAKNSIACVRTDEFSLGNKIVISNNTMKLNLAAFGVVNYELSAGEIKQNSIEMNNNANSYGIMVYAGGKNVYKCNSVYALQTYNNPQVAIAVSSSRANELSCNWVNRQQNGINFYGACNDTRLRGNSMNNHDIGLGIYYDGIIGVQYHNGNTWNGLMSSYGAYLSGIDQNLADLNKFYYLSSGTNNYPSVTNDPGYDWFHADNDGEEFSCAKFDCRPTIPREEEGGKPEDGEIAVNSGNSDPISQATNYFADRFLFEKLKSNSDLLLNNPILQAFFSQQLSGNIGVFSGLDEEIADAVKWETVYALTYSTNETIIKNATDTLNDLDSLLRLNPGDIVLENQMKEVNERVKITQESNRLIYETIKQIQDFKNSNALSGNGAVISSEVYEINEAKINEIYLNTVAKGVFNFDSYQTNEIVGIMNQCPYTGGNAVYEARSLYSLIDPDYIWNDNVICALGGTSPRLGKKIDKVFSVYPNPTTGMINLTYELENDQFGEIIITDALGVRKAIEKLDHNSSEMNINLSNLAPGIYYYSILVNSIPEKNGVITIIK